MIKYTKLRMFAVALLGAILLSGVTIFMFEKSIPSFTNPMITAIFASEDYEYSLSIPDYWDKYSADIKESKVVYTGNNSEYLSIQASEYPKTYDSEMYGTFKALEFSRKYNVTDIKFEKQQINDIPIYVAKFSVNKLDYVVGFSENDGFIIDFEYRIASENSINTNLYNIISSIERFKIEEVEINGTNTEE